MSLYWRNTHCKERREIEEYSPLKVTDSNNNFIKESVKFSEHFLKTNPSYFFIFTSESELQKKGEKKRVFSLCVFRVFCVLKKEEERSVIYSASRRAESYFGVRTIAPLQRITPRPTHRSCMKPAGPLCVSESK